MGTLTMPSLRGAAAPIDWGVAWHPIRGESTSGDLHLVHAFDGGVLVAAIDGLGHGTEAAFAARRAVEALTGSDHHSIVTLVQRCHEACRRTRGVALSLALFNPGDDTVTWLGIGNVEGILVRANQKREPPREMILLRGGIVGQELPPLRASLLDVEPGDTLVFATDGVQAAFVTDLPQPLEAPQRLAERVLERHASGIDDALVLAVQYRAGRVT